MKIIKELIPYVIIVVLALLIRTFLVTPVKVDGISMYPTLEDSQILILEKFHKNYNRFDIVVINYNGEKLVKRIIGMPGEEIEYRNNVLYVNGRKIEEPIDVTTNDFSTSNMGNKNIPKDSYLVLGDNRNNSTDSRVIGFINKKDIIGKANLRIWPINKMGKI